MSRLRKQRLELLQRDGETTSSASLSHENRRADFRRPLFSKLVLNLWQILRLVSRPPVDQLPLDASCALLRLVSVAGSVADPRTRSTAAPPMLASSRAAQGEGLVQRRASPPDPSRTHST